MIFFLVVAASSSSSSSVGGPLISGETGDPGVVGYGAQHTSDPMEVERGDWDPLTLSQLLPGDDEVVFFSQMLVHHPVESSSDPQTSSSNSPVEVSARAEGHDQEVSGLVPAKQKKSDIKKLLEHSLQFIKKAIKNGLEATLVVDPKQKRSKGTKMFCFYQVPNKIDKLNRLLNELDENDRNQLVKQINFIKVEIVPRIEEIKNAQKEFYYNRSANKHIQKEKQQPFRNKQAKLVGEIKEKLDELEHS